MIPYIIIDSMKRLWIVTELFYPEETSTAYILTKIANHLAGTVDVNVICGPALYDGAGRQNVGGELDKRVKVHRVSGTKLNKNGLFTRVLRFAVLTWKLTKSLRKNLRKGDEILVVTNPAPILLSAAAIRKRRGNKLYLLVHDVFPENTIPAGIIKSEKSFLYKLLKSCFDKAYAAADTLIVLGRDMKIVVEDKILAKGGKGNVVIVENWAELDKISPKRCMARGYVELQYAGNLGRVQGLMELLQCIKSSSNSFLHITFYGEGAVKAQMQNFVKEQEMANVSFKGSYKRDDQNEILNSCDLAVVTLADGMYGLGVPSKTYNILAAGKPILFIGDENSEVAMMLKEYGIGFVFGAHDTEGLVAFMDGLSPNSCSKLEIMGTKAREIAELYYSESAIMQKYIDLFGKN